MLKLYEYTDQYLEVMNTLQDFDVGNDAISDTLEALKGEIEIKGKNIAFYIQNMNASVDALKKHEKDIKDKRIRFEKRNEWLKNYLLRGMQDVGITEIECDYFTIKQHKNPDSVWIFDENLVPDKYKKTIEVIKIDKVAMAKDLKEGETIDGAKLHHGWRLAIK